MMYNLWKIFRR